MSNYEVNTSWTKVKWSRVKELFCGKGFWHNFGRVLNFWHTLGRFLILVICRAILEAKFQPYWRQVLALLKENFSLVEVEFQVYSGGRILVFEGPIQASFGGKILEIWRPNSSVVWGPRSGALQAKFRFGLKTGFWCLNAELKTGLWLKLQSC